jgi:hypothetical protein
MNTTSPITLKLNSIYIAYAPEFELAAYGSYRDEALNNLGDELRLRHGVKVQTGEERK